MATSDSPVIYDISPEGITLPTGYSFHAHGHINYKVATLDGTYLRTENMHFDPNNGHPGGAYIGQTFFPFNLADGECVSWVQLGHNKVELNNPHFGEGGQEPVCKEGTQPEPPATEEPDEIDCPEGTVPGWLDENGNAQGCVNNQPVPGKQLPKETPTDGVSQTVQPVTTLADTGTPEAFTALIIGVALVVSGLAIYLKGSKR